MKLTPNTYFNFTFMKSRFTLILFFAFMASISVAQTQKQPAGSTTKTPAKTETKQETKKGEVTMKTTLDLKADGGTLTGKVTTSGGRREVTTDVADGKVDGNKISFMTTQSTRKGDTKIKWEATLEGDSLKGTRSVEGRKRGQEFVAKRAN